jgi:hypothetical protein
MSIPLRTTDELSAPGSLSGPKRNSAKSAADKITLNLRIRIFGMPSFMWAVACSAKMNLYRDILIESIATQLLISSAAGAAQLSPGWKRTRKRATKPWVWNGIRQAL